MTEDIFEKRKQEFLKIAEELAEQFYKKNKDYGDAYFKSKEFSFEIDKKLDNVDFYVQLRRKFARLANFAEKRLNGDKTENLVIDETEDDTIKDIAIYCIMEIIKRRENKQK